MTDAAPASDLRVWACVWRRRCLGGLGPAKGWGRVQERMHRASAKPSGCRPPAVPGICQARAETGIAPLVPSRFKARSGVTRGEKIRGKKEVKLLTLPPGAAPVQGLRPSALCSPAALPGVAPPVGTWSCSSADALGPPLTCCSPRAPAAPAHSPAAAGGTGRQQTKAFSLFPAFQSPAGTSYGLNLMGSQQARESGKCSLQG